MTTRFISEATGPSRSQRRAPCARRLPRTVFHAIAATLIAHALVLSANGSPTYAQTSAPVTSTSEPITGGRLYATGTEITIAVLPTEGTFYTSELLLFDGASSRVLTTNDATGTVVPIGAFLSGTELVFGIRVLDTGQVYRTGPSDRNPDDTPHATVQFLEPGRIRLAFEDVYGGGDKDFDDAVFELRGGVSITQERPQDTESSPTPTPKKANKKANKKAKKSNLGNDRCDEGEICVWSDYDYTGCFYDFTPKRKNEDRDYSDGTPRWTNCTRTMNDDISSYRNRSSTHSVIFYTEQGSRGDRFCGWPGASSSDLRNFDHIFSPTIHANDAFSSHTTVRGRTDSSIFLIRNPRCWWNDED